MTDQTYATIHEAADEAFRAGDIAALDMLEQEAIDRGHYGALDYVRDCQALLED